jgi:dolichyl-phosphate beta-glucosyltransferase
MHLSIIIPAWNEASKIANDISDIIHFVEKLNDAVELIIVDDGSKDDTSKIADEVLIPKSLQFRLISYHLHRGKGYAVRKGISESHGEHVMFIDSGRNVPLSYIISGLELIKQKKCDIVIGSRYLPGSVITKKLIWYRQITSSAFRLFTKWYLSLPEFVSDTQCGFKIFRGNIARELFKECNSDGFVFDLEILLLALGRNYQICEIPLEWRCDRDSRLSLFHSFFPIFRELRRLKLRFS